MLSKIINWFRGLVLVSKPGVGETTSTDREDLSKWNVKDWDVRSPKIETQLKSIVKPVQWYYITDDYSTRFKVGLWGCSFFVYVLINGSYECLCEGHAHTGNNLTKFNNATLKDAVEIVEMYHLTEEEKKEIYQGRLTLSEVKY